MFIKILIQSKMYFDSLILIRLFFKKFFIHLTINVKILLFLKLYSNFACKTLSKTLTTFNESMFTMNALKF